MYLITLIQAAAIAFHILPIFAELAKIPIIRPSGHYKVGALDIKLEDKSRHDYFSPSESRKIVVTFHYPTDKTTAFLRPYIPFTIQPIVEADYTIPPGELSRLVSNSYQYAIPAKLPSPAAIIFSPGFRSSRYLYTILCEDLASHGFVVISIDHPYDALAVEYPGTNKTVLMHPSAGNATLDTIHPFHTQRAEDMTFLAGVLKDWLRRLGVHTESVNALKIGAFGHSLGGATSAGAMQRTKLIQAGLNMDGFFVNGTTTDDAIKNVERPFVIMGAGEHNSTSEKTWREWKKYQSGWYKELNLVDSGHLSYGDFGAFVEQLGLRDKMDKQFLEGYLGGLNGERAVKVQREYIRDFFDWQLRGGEGEFFKQAQKDFPEMVFME